MRTLFLTIFFTFLLLYVQGQEENEKQSPFCGGVERWAVKVITDADSGNINFTPIETTIDNLIHMNVPVPGSGTARIVGIEDKVFKIRCRITIKKTEDDDDYHLVLSDDDGNTLIGEAPDPLCSTVYSSAYVNQFIATRHFIDSTIAPGNVNNVNLPEVEVTGVAFIDIDHGQTGAAPNQMELHPILDIQFAPATGVLMIPPALLSVTLSPNPSHGNLSLKILSLINLDNCSLQVYDTKASLIAEYNLPVQPVNQINTLIDLNVLPGPYIYRIVNAGTLLYDGKMVVE